MYYNNYNNGDVIIRRPIHDIIKIDNISLSDNNEICFPLLKKPIVKPDFYLLKKNNISMNKNTIHSNNNNNVVLCPIYYNNHNRKTNMYQIKGAGIIPYSLVNGRVYFLLQHAEIPCSNKNIGWNDFGGKRNKKSETTLEIAAREFNEETSCLFYLKDINNDELYSKLKHNESNKNNYNNETTKELINMIPIANEHYIDKIKKKYISINARNTYMSYFIKVPYISADDLPKSEDMHIPYTFRYTRNCKWFTYEEMMGCDNFHSRLHAAKIKKKLKYFHDKKLFN